MRPRSFLLIVTIVLLFLLIMVGAYVTAAGDGEACGSSIPNDYPFCLGHVLPPLRIAPIAEWSHRLLASLSAFFLFLTTFLFWRAKDSPLAARRSLYVACVLIVFEIILGAAVVATVLPPWLVTVHQANAMLIFALTCVSGAFAYKS